MDSSAAFDPPSNSSDDEAMTEVLDATHEVAETDQGKHVSIAEHGDQSKAETSDTQEGAALQNAPTSAAKRVAKTNTVYLDMQCDPSGKATVKLMDPSTRCMMTPDSPQTWVMEETRPGEKEQLPKLVEHHLVKVLLETGLPFNLMLVVAQIATSLLQNVASTNEVKSSSLPYGIKGLKAIDHKQKPDSQIAKKFRFSKTAVEDRTSDLVKERRMKVLHFHTNSSKHDWQCFISLDDSKYVDQFGNDEDLVFETAMAAAIEVLEQSQTERRRRPSRPRYETDMEVIARAKYLGSVSRELIATQEWYSYLAGMYDRTSATQTPLVVVDRDQSPSAIVRQLERVYAARRQEQQQQRLVEADAESAEAGLSDSANVVPVAKSTTDEVEGSDNAKDGPGIGVTASVEGHGNLDGTDVSSEVLSANARKKKKGEGRHTKNRAKASLASKPSQHTMEEDDLVALTEEDDPIALTKEKNDVFHTEEDCVVHKEDDDVFGLTEEDSVIANTEGYDVAIHMEGNDVVGLTKSGSSSLSDQNPRLNTGKTPDPALHPTYGESSRSSSCSTNINDHTIPMPAEAAEMDDLRGSMSTMALEGEEERLGVEELQQNNSSDENSGWQTVTHGKKRKSLDKNPALAAPFSWRAPPAATPTTMARISAARRNRQTPASTSEDLSTIHSTPTASTVPAASVTPTFNEEEFPDLPTPTQSEEAIRKVMTKKQKGKDKRKRQRAALERQSSQSSSDLLGPRSVTNATGDDQQMTSDTQLQTSDTPIQDEAEEDQDSGSEEAVPKVMNRKQKKKEKAKRKKRQAALERESAQSSNDLLGPLLAINATRTDQEMPANPQSQSPSKLVQEASERIQDNGSDEVLNVTDNEITPNASMINLAAARARKLNSTPAPPSTSAGQSSSTPAPSSSISGEPGSTSGTSIASAAGLQATIAQALPPSSGAEPRTHKFGALEGPTRIVCRLPACDVTTSPWDGSTVICPGCGPYSSIRYCCIDHLLSDTTDHWGLDCMKYTCNHPCDASTIHPRQVQCPPLIPNLCGWNNPERHRQAVYHAHSSKKNGSAEIEGDYFIFTDGKEWLEAGSPDIDAVGVRRGRGTLLAVVTFNDDASPNSLKDRFNRLLNAALFTGLSNTPVLDYLFMMIRENLMSNDKWDDEVLNCLFYQFVQEYGYAVPELITNNKRHACPQQWFGTPVDMCEDLVCNELMLHHTTRRPLYQRLAIREKTDELERRYWILRVARVYHPNIRDEAARMRGVGFAFVPPGNRRMYCRGREWDGYPNSPMEIEGATLVRMELGPPRLQAADLVTLTV